jgi:hypothetical protein
MNTTFGEQMGHKMLQLFMKIVFPQMPVVVCSTRVEADYLWHNRRIEAKGLQWQAGHGVRAQGLTASQIRRVQRGQLDGVIFHNFHWAAAPPGGMTAAEHQPTIVVLSREQLMANPAQLLNNGQILVANCPAESVISMGLPAAELIRSQVVDLLQQRLDGMTYPAVPAQIPAGVLAPAAAAAAPPPQPTPGALLELLPPDLEHYGQHISDGYLMRWIGGDEAFEDYRRPTPAETVQQTRVKFAAHLDGPGGPL